MNKFDFDRWAEQLDPPAEQIAGVIRNYYPDYASWSPFNRFGLWAPARVDGHHRFEVVTDPDGYENATGLGQEISRLQGEHPGENIFVAGWADYSPEYHGMDWWPLGIVTPTDFRICFRYTNGLRNENSGQPLRYALFRKRFQSKNVG